jgi:hypothetical protein
MSVEYELKNNTMLLDKERKTEKRMALGRSVKTENS